MKGFFNKNKNPKKKEASTASNSEGSMMENNFGTTSGGATGGVNSPVQDEYAVVDKSRKGNAEKKENVFMVLNDPAIKALRAEKEEEKEEDFQLDDKGYMTHKDLMAEIKQNKEESVYGNAAAVIELTKQEEEEIEMRIAKQVAEEEEVFQVAEDFVETKDGKLKKRSEAVKGTEGLNYTDIDFSGRRGAKGRSEQAKTTPKEPTVYEEVDFSKAPVVPPRPPKNIQKEEVFQVAEDFVETKDGKLKKRSEAVKGTEGLNYTDIDFSGRRGAEGRSEQAKTTPKEPTVYEEVDFSKAPVVPPRPPKNIQNKKERQQLGI